MSDSLQSLAKILLLGIFWMAAFSQASAYQIAASPPEIMIYTEPEQEACRSITVQSDSDMLQISTLWSVQKSRAIEEFTLNQNQEGINVSAPNEINGPKSTIRICVITHDAYVHYGLIKIEDLTKNAGLGIWITINPNNSEKSITKKKTIPSITGAAISESQEKESQNINLTTYLMIGTILLTLTLVFLIVKIRQNRRV